MYIVNISCEFDNSIICNILRGRNVMLKLAKSVGEVSFRVPQGSLLKHMNVFTKVIV